MHPTTSLSWMEDGRRRPLREETEVETEEIYDMSVWMIYRVLWGLKSLCLYILNLYMLV